MHVFPALLPAYSFWVDSDPKNFVSVVTDALKARREELGWSHEKVAKEAGLHRSTVSRVESKKINGTLYVFQAIANALEVHLSDLCKQAEEKGRG